MELIYRIQTDHGGRLLASEAHKDLGPLAAAAARRAERLSWLVTKGSPAVLTAHSDGLLLSLSSSPMLPLWTFEVAAAGLIE